MNTQGFVRKLFFLRAIHKFSFIQTFDSPRVFMGVGGGGVGGGGGVETTLFWLHVSSQNSGSVVSFKSGGTFHSTKVLRRGGEGGVWG